jgi:hypothetical protein
MKGRTATAREIKARWAYSEVLSDRFGGPYSLILNRPLLDQIKDGCAFCAIDEGHWNFLILGLNTARSPC